jgi:hypothetical protein
MGNCAPDILEKCVHALTLLGYLVESGLPFLFKGGTSLLLHLPQTRRLSRDIDIVCGIPTAEVDTFLSSVAKRSPFARYEEDPRGARGLPRRRHFKFYYRSSLQGYGDEHVLLDIIEDAREVHTSVDRLIRTDFLEPERQIMVRVPTIEGLLGDKLTAFAPNTVGVPLRKSDGSAGDVQQVAKQLFDVGGLFDAASDFARVTETYHSLQSIESEYRNTKPTLDASLNDTWSACLALSATKRLHLAAYPDAPLLHDGFERLKGHLTWPEFMQGREPRRLLAAKAAVVVAHIRSGRAYDFAAMRYTGSPEQIELLRSSSFNGHALSWLDGLRGPNPEAYHYWRLALLAEAS